MNSFQVFEAFQDVILVVDREGRAYFGNNAACVLFEVAPRRLASKKSLTQFVSFEPMPYEVDGSLDQVNQIGQMKEVSFTLPSGTTGWVQVTVQPLPEHFIDKQAAGPEESVRLWIVSMRDVTLEKALHVKYRAELDQKESFIHELQEARAALEQYSQLLEKKVEERTQELREANRLQKTILDSLDQGILVYDKDGQCLPVFSKVCARILEGEPTGRSITEVLGLAGAQAEDFTSWGQAVFDQLLDFEDMIPLALHHLRNKAGREIGLDYYPLLGADERLNGIVVVATDRTNEMAALRKAEEERTLVNKVTQVARNREAFRLFISEAKRLLSELSSAGRLDLEEVARNLHTLKGGAASFSLMNLAASSHDLETELKVLTSGGNMDPNTNERVKELLEGKTGELFGVLDAEIVSLTELLGAVIPANEADGQTVEISSSKLKVWSESLYSARQFEQVREVGKQLLLECVEKQVGTSIRHLSSSLKDLASQMGKSLEAFELKGDDIKVSPVIVKGLIASLVHAFRNAVCHGLETVEERKAKGKHPGGRISARFERHESGWLSIVIEDDGRGIDPEKIRSKLREKGLAELATVPDDEVIQVILRDDFSTADSVDMVAGRGVGLSAIAAEAKALGGTVHVSSRIGEGMKLTIRTPLPEVPEIRALELRSRPKAA
jgi:two-component system, chemotaxis family, sensor kinase CheA